MAFFVFFIFVLSACISKNKLLNISENYVTMSLVVVHYILTKEAVYGTTCRFA